MNAARAAVAASQGRLVEATLLFMLSACMRNDDLTTAIAGGVGRTVSDAPTVSPIAWEPVVGPSDGEGEAQKPVAVVWCGDRLLVGDVLGGTARLLSVPGSASPAPTELRPTGVGARPFMQLADIACNERANRVLVADAGASRVYLFDLAGNQIADVPAPPTPQGVPLLGVFSIADDGSWFDSWLGSTINVGPYLSDADWNNVTLVRHWAPDGRQLGAFGDPRRYTNTVARRVFNRTGLAYRRGSLWVLTEADATLRAFDNHGRETRSAVALPVYHRGSEPRISVGQRVHPSLELRTNKLAYQPNVRGLALVGDGQLVTARFRKWRFIFRRDIAHGFFDYWPESSIEMYDERGVALAAYSAPGRVRRVAGNSRGQVAIISESVDQHLSILVAQVPPAVLARQSQASETP